MPPVPSVSGEKVVKALERHGFKLVRVTGSHHVMRHSDGRGAVVLFPPRVTTTRLGTDAKLRGAAESVIVRATSKR